MLTLHVYSKMILERKCRANTVHGAQAQAVSDMIALPTPLLRMHGYRKFPKYSDTPKICCNHSKI